MDVLHARFLRGNADAALCRMKTQTKVRGKRGGTEI